MKSPKTKLNIKPRLARGMSVLAPGRTKCAAHKPCFCGRRCCCCYSGRDGGAEGGKRGRREVRLSAERDVPFRGSCSTRSLLGQAVDYVGHPLYAPPQMSRKTNYLERGPFKADLLTADLERTINEAFCTQGRVSLFFTVDYQFQYYTGVVVIARKTRRARDARPDASAVQYTLYIKKH